MTNGSIKPLLVRHPPLPEWFGRIQRAQPIEVRFAHDLAVRRPDRLS